MKFEHYRIIYINIILLILFLTNQLFLFLVICIYKIPYILNFESDVEYQFDYIYLNLEDIGARYLENDIDNDFFYTLNHMQNYLNAECRFFFDVLGGETTLDHIDFLEFTIYSYNDKSNPNNNNEITIKTIKLNRNYKYIYNSNLILRPIKNIKNLYRLKIYQILDDNYNDNLIKKDIKKFKKIFEVQNNNQNKNKNNIKNKYFIYDNNKVSDLIKNKQRVKLLNINKKNI